MEISRGFVRSTSLVAYSATPLVKKLGIKERFRIRLVDAPADFSSLLGELPDGVTRVGPRATGPLNLIVLFVKTQADLREGVRSYAGRLAPAGMLWVAWPKQSSGEPTDLRFDVVQATGLAAGLVDTKICAIDPVWSALKFVIRVKDRPPRA
jgi:hypothetical protein